MNTMPGKTVLPAKGVFIANRWRPAASGRAIPVLAPADGLPFAQIAAGEAADVHTAVAAARAAMEGAWGRMPAFERGRILSRLARLIADNEAELAALEARDTGKPMKQAKADIVACAR